MLKINGTLLPPLMTTAVICFMRNCFYGRPPGSYTGTRRGYPNYGLAYCYYVDCHSTFRFVQGRDSLWRKHYSLTDDVDPQWKQEAGDLGINITYALSPQATRAKLSVLTGGFRIGW